MVPEVVNKESRNLTIQAQKNMKYQILENLMRGAEAATCRDKSKVGELWRDGIL